MKLVSENKIKPIRYFLIIILILSTEMIVMVDTADTTSYKPMAPDNKFLLKADEITIKSHFNQIHEKKFSLSSMNCSTKSHLFASYLLSIDAKNVKIMDINPLKGEYGHEVVSWDNRVYDATSGYYNVSKTEYLSWIKTKGFDGLIVETPFIPSNF
ncbi:MAG: hypothetical protein CVV28_02765 [Methanobacteriales archaeon HGW-Methanobacteriales-1]|nr:MAG: hypothetical protein CVV28_02765 [Methanobacteriales archaeon HGW-Methanobacteriales-1]